MPHILIILSIINATGYMRGDEHNTNVITQRFETLEACRYAAQEVARQNSGWGRLRMSCVPIAHQATKEPHSGQKD